MAAMYSCAQTPYLAVLGFHQKTDRALISIIRTTQKEYVEAYKIQPMPHIPTYHQEPSLYSGQRFTEQTLTKLEWGVM